MLVSLLGSLLQGRDSVAILRRPACSAVNRLRLWQHGDEAARGRGRWGLRKPSGRGPLTLALSQRERELGARSIRNLCVHPVDEPIAADGYSSTMIDQR